MFTIILPYPTVFICHPIDSQYTDRIATNDPLLSEYTYWEHLDQYEFAKFIGPVDLIFTDLKQDFDDRIHYDTYYKIGLPSILQ